MLIFTFVIMSAFINSVGWVYVRYSWSQKFRNPEVIFNNATHFTLTDCGLRIAVVTITFLHQSNVSYLSNFQIPGAVTVIHTTISEHETAEPSQHCECGTCHKTWHLVDGRSEMLNPVKRLVYGCLHLSTLPKLWQITSRNTTFSVRVELKMHVCARRHTKLTHFSHKQNLIMQKDHAWAQQTVHRLGSGGAFRVKSHTAP